MSNSHFLFLYLWMVRLWMAWLFGHRSQFNLRSWNNFLFRTKLFFLFISFCYVIKNRRNVIGSLFYFWKRDLIWWACLWQVWIFFWKDCLTLHSIVHMQYTWIWTYRDTDIQYTSFFLDFFSLFFFFFVCSPMVSKFWAIGLSPIL